MNKTSLIWEKIEASKSKERPTAREGHILVYLPDQNKYLIFGGISNKRYSDIYTLCLTTMTWVLERPRVQNKETSENPKELSYCIGWYDEPLFFIHGGRNKETALPDIYVLDTRTWIWRKVAQIDQPPSRYHHAYARLKAGKEVYIFGGYNEKSNKNFGDLLVYDYSGINFSQDKVDGGIWTKIENSSGSVPSARSGHQMVSYKDNIILFGGITDRGYDDDKFYLYEIKNNTWEILAITGSTPNPRSYHTMSYFKPGFLVIFGGKARKEDKLNYQVSNELYYIDIENLNSSTPFVANVSPSARFGHAGSFNSGFNPPEHLIVGGLDKTYGALDVYRIVEIELNSDKKWVYEQKKLHSSANVNYEDKDDIFETAKRTIIDNKKQIEILENKNLQVNREYTSLFNQLSVYKKNLQEEDMNTNVKRSQQKIQRLQLENEKKELLSQCKELEEYNNFIDIELHLLRKRYLALSEYIEDVLKTMKKIDNWICSVDKSPNTVLYFSGVDKDDIVFKRDEFKKHVEKYKEYFKEVVIYEKELYSKIQKMQEKQLEDYKLEYFLSEDKKIFSFQEKNDYLNESFDSHL